MNRQIFPSSLFPLDGDISAGAGATTVEVVGLQTIPFSAAPTEAGQVPTYDPVAGTIDWDLASGGIPASIEIEGVGTAIDDQIFINGVTDGGGSPWAIHINGVSDGG